MLIIHAPFLNANANCAFSKDIRTDYFNLKFDHPFEGVEITARYLAP